MHPNSPCAWLLAARPKTLTAAVVPVMLGCALAYADRQFQGSSRRRKRCCACSSPA